MSNASHPTHPQAGLIQGILIITIATLPAMGVVLLAPIAAQMQKAIAAAQGGSAALSAIALTAPALAIAFLAPVGGLLVDRFGCRRTIIAALICYALLGMAPFWLENPLAIVAARLALGATGAIMIPARFTLLSSYFSGKTLDKWIAYNSTTIALAATAFYLIGGFLGEISWKAPFITYIVALPLAALAAWKIFEPVKAKKPEGAAPQDGGSSFSALRSLGALFGIAFVSAIFFYAIPLQLGNFLSERGVSSPAAIGTIIAIAGLGNPIGAFAFRFVRGYPPSTLMGVSAAVAATGLVFAGLTPGMIALVIGAFVNQIGCGLFMPAAYATVIRQAPLPHRGKVGGLWSTTSSLGQFASPLIVLQAIALGHSNGGLIILGVANAIFAVACVVILTAVGLNRKQDAQTA